ncbi:LysM domain/BON superfamily protein [Actinobacillus equuli]|nr:LysM domain/BON superfamily protein [Actinobacillus equuli]
MGLFDFAANIGKKLFNKEEEASQAVTEHLNEDNPGVENVQVTVENGVANLSGVAATAAAVEKAVLMAGNIEGISEVKIDGVQIANGEALAGDDEFYVIQKGDTYGKLQPKLTATVQNIKRSLKRIKK